MEASVVWRALERPGHEHCRLWTNGLEGDVVVVVDGRPCAFTYRVQCDASWRTESVGVEGWIGTEPFAISFAPDAHGGWTANVGRGFSPPSPGGRGGE